MTWNIRRTLFLIILVLAAIFASASANIPPGLHTSVPEPTIENRCSEYIATSSSDRIDQWLYTIQHGLMNNPELDNDVWDCVMDIYKMSETDQFMVRGCKSDPHADFDDLAFAALTEHLDKCDVSITR